MLSGLGKPPGWGWGHEQGRWPCNHENIVELGTAPHLDPNVVLLHLGTKAQTSGAGQDLKRLRVGKGRKEVGQEA